MPNVNSQLQVHKEHYLTERYNHKARWLSYFYQIKLLQKIKAKNVLEIGPGIGLVTQSLRTMGFQVTTVDIDSELKPDVVARVDSLPFADNAFDAVLAAEVLEHLPFERLCANAKELRRVAKDYVIISLPDHRRTLIQLSLKLPFIPYLNIFLKIPSFKKHVFDGQHYWEIGKISYPVSRIKSELEKSGLKVVESFVSPDAPMNHYFVLKK